MTTLRITQTTESTGRYRVELSLHVDGLAPQSATASFRFEMPPQDREDLRWYLEDYLQFPHDPAPTIAARIERRMTEIGTELFTAVFDSSTQATRLWAKVYERASDLRVEIVTSVRQAAAIPWELLRDPYTDTVLALTAAAFVRTHQEAAVTPKPFDAASGPIRILLVICRPKQGDDVPFRSVASRLVKALTDDARAVFQLDVLRPPTYDQFSKTLRQAKRDGRPYHVVHFDGHGMYAELSEDDGGHVASAWLASLIPLMLSGPREGSHGFLLFENPANAHNLQLVDGDSLGKLLYETNTPVLVLNACRSAHADVAEQPEHADSSDEMHAQVRAFGSLAQEVIDAGVTGVVAMRYNVYVVTAAQFVADLYAALVRGNTLGEAVTLGRKQLRENPNRTIALAPRPLQDWCVPLVYEAMPTALFQPKRGTQALSIKVAAAESSASAGSLDRALPDPPDVGFFGRDETLLALDRAFDTQPIVLLHAYAGSGKTATSAEFARWYSLTGGVAGPVLFTSFEQHQPLARVLDRVGEVFGTVLEQSGLNWLALDDDNRRRVAIQVLKQIPVLWIWDNVEQIAGFPAGTKSAWSKDEQRELVDFLRDVARTKAKFLLTSRREEREWLGDNLPCRIPVPPMPMQERVQLARAIAQRQRRKVTDVDDWRPLLRFTDGNPLTITVLVGQALRDGLKTRDQIEAFVQKLRSDAADFEDDASQGRDRSLALSLSYGFEHGFNEDERRMLGLLYLFQGFVNVQVLVVMGGDEIKCQAQELRGVTREEAISLLDRAAEVGLLTAHGGGYYSIHPALPWYFRKLFDEYVARNSVSLLVQTDWHPTAVTRSFVEAIGELGDHLHRQYNEGERRVTDELAAQEANLLFAHELARNHGWWESVKGTMQGLRVLYQHTGRSSDWSRLVHEVVPDFVDPGTDGPLPGHETDWHLVTEYRISLAKERRDWQTAERLQRLCVDWDRDQVENVVRSFDGNQHCRDESLSIVSALKPILSELDYGQRNLIRSLAASLCELGYIQSQSADPDCVVSQREALDLMELLADYASATVALGLAQSYLDVPPIRDLTQAEYWTRSSLERRNSNDGLGRSDCHGKLGMIALERFREARAASRPEVELLSHLNGALARYREAINLTPLDAFNSLATLHNQLGTIYAEAGHTDCALADFRKAIALHEQNGDLYLAGDTRRNVALALAQASRLSDAREYALAAIRNFQMCGVVAAVAAAERTQRLLADIEQLAKQQNE